MSISELSLSDLHKRIAACSECALAKGRTRSVPGDGPETAAIMFIGEAPGWHEDQQGRPFVGPAGQFLTELLESIKLKRSGVFITNVVKCRPPANREPLPGELAACRKYLDRQIELIKPRVIVTLGRFSMARYFSNESISRIHGKARRENGMTYFAMYHPAAALHQADLRKVLEQDILKLPQLLVEMDKAPEPPTPAAPPEPEPQQLNLF